MTKTKSLIEIKETSPEVAFEVHKNIPEFDTHPPYDLGGITKECSTYNSLVLVAYLDNTPAGYCISVDKFKDGSFYNWITGVLLKYRNRGIYTSLNAHLETWAQAHGYKSIKVKTWNRRIEMRIALAKLNYHIIALEEKSDVLDSRLMHEKVLALKKQYGQ